MRALLADLKQFDVATMEERAAADGIVVQTMKRADSLTREGVAYVFASDVFTGDAARVWLSEHGIQPIAFEDGEEIEFEVMATGTFRPQSGGEVTIALSDLEQIATTSNALIDAGMLRPPMKLGHDDDQAKTRALFPEGGEPALGWVRRLRVEGDRLIATACDVPKRFREALAAKAWRTRSAEILPTWTDPTGKVHSMVFRALAWLGATRPAIPHLADLVGLSAEDRAVLRFDFNEGENGSGGPTDGDAKDATDSAAADAAARESASASNKLRREIEMAENAALQAELDAMKARAAAAEAARDADRKALVGVKLAEAVKDRRITPGQVEGETVIAMAQADPMGYIATVFARPQMPDMTKSAGDTNPDGTAKPSEKKGEARLIELAEVIAKDKQIPYAEALCLAAEAEPETYRTYYVEAHPLRSAAKEGR